jgi:hypothetical protein
MLSLESLEWSELEHAYGAASDIPNLLRMLVNLPGDEGKDEPWFSLWSALAHQGDVYPASFAAVPHVIAALEINPSAASNSFFQFPAWVEICRRKNELTIPKPLQDSYVSALAKLPGLALAGLESRNHESERVRCALSAIAVAKGEWQIAEVILELEPDVASECIEWLESR